MRSRRSPFPRSLLLGIVLAGALAPPIEAARVDVAAAAARGRALALEGEVAAAIEAWNDVLVRAPQAAPWAVPVAAACTSDALANVLERHRHLAPTWIAGGADGCRTLLWGAFSSAEEARAAAALVPGASPDAVVELRAPLEALVVPGPEPATDVGVVARRESASVRPPGAVRDSRRMPRAEPESEPETDPVPSPGDFDPEREETEPEAPPDLGAREPEPAITSPAPDEAHPVEPAPARPRERPAPGTTRETTPETTPERTRRAAAPRESATTRPPSTVPDRGAELEPVPQAEPEPDRDAESLFAEGNRAYARGDLEGSIELFRRSLEADPTSIRARNNLGTALLLADRAREAEEQFRLALREDEDYARAWMNLGTALYAQDRPEQTRAAFQRALELEPTSIDAHYNLASLHVELGEWKEAETMLEAGLALDPGNARLVKALDDVRQQLALRENPQGSGGGAPTAGPCAGRLGDTDRAELAAQLVETGRAAYARDDHRGAELAFQRALECDPTSAEVLNHLGAARLKLDRPAAAIEAFEVALRYDPDLVVSAINLAFARAGQGDCDAAIRGLRELTLRRPSTCEPRYQLGRLLWRCGRSTEAHATLLEAVPQCAGDDRPGRLLQRIEQATVTVR